MIEYYTRGIVLSRTPRGEADATVTIYTKELGKVSAFVKSIRKLTSKLSPYLQQGNIVDVRLIEKNQIQVVDALGVRSMCELTDALRFVKFLDQVVPLGGQDLDLWHAVEHIMRKCDFSSATYRSILTHIGFLAQGATCENCKEGEIAYFNAPDIIFVCASCGAMSHINKNEFINVRKV